ncbi:MAG: hypothetical protein ACFFG0_11500 [Candidatus Thorarchaeota archaeon]
MRDTEILEMLEQKVDPITITRQLNVPLNSVTSIMKSNTHLVNKNYQSVIQIEDDIDRALAYMKERKEVSKRIPLIQTIIKLKQFIKVPRSTWECIAHAKVPYNKLYGAFKQMGIVKGNALSPISLDLILLKSKSQKIDILQWRRDQIKRMYRQHNVTLKRCDKITARFRDILEKNQPGDLGLFPVLHGINIYTDFLSTQNEYPNLIFHVEDFLTLMQSNFFGFTNYQAELMLGLLLRSREIDLIGFKKESSYFTTSGRYPLFIINNKALIDFCWGVRKALLALENTSAGENPTSAEWIQIMHNEIDHLSDKQVTQEAFDGALQTFKPKIADLLKRMCWQSPTILMELYKFVIFHKNEYTPVTLEYIQKESQKANSERERMDIQSRINAEINNKVNSMMAIGFLKYHKSFDLEDIFKALTFFEVRYQICFYLMCNLFGISVFEDLSADYLKRMKPRPTKEYGERVRKVAKKAKKWGRRKRNEEKSEKYRSKKK